MKIYVIEDEYDGCTYTTTAYLYKQNAVKEFEKLRSAMKTKAEAEGWELESDEDSYFWDGHKQEWRLHTIEVEDALGVLPTEPIPFQFNPNPPKTIPLNRRNHEKIQDLLIHLWELDKNGWCNMTDGTHDDLSDDDAVTALTETINSILNQDE